MVTAASFIAFLLIFTGIGVYSATRKRETADDYLVASRDVSPGLASLSAVASNNSGFMFLGLIGVTYVDGMRAMWLMVGWIFGDWIAWIFVHRKLREKTEEINTIPAFLGHGIRGGHRVAAVAGLIVLLFLGTYAAGQLLAGGKALFHVTGWSVQIGIVIGAVIVVAYCFAGGIRASIWTDVAQSVVMIASMALLLLVAALKVGGLPEIWARLEAIDPALTVLFPDYRFGFAGFLLGWVGAGLGVVGQPHIMIRAMAMDRPENMTKARRIYISWYVVFSAACIGVGLAARVLLPEEPQDAELSLLLLSDHLFAGGLTVVVGIMLAGVFAATISTADSQILSCSASVTHDVAPKLGQSYSAVKGATLGVAALALVIALSFGESVFGVVTFAWSTLASGLGPLLVIRVMGWRISEPAALATMLGGVTGSFAWYFAGLADAVYQVFPGMLSGFAVYTVIRLFVWLYPDE